MNKLKKKLVNTGSMIILLMISLLSFIPFYFMITMSTHVTSEIYQGDVFWFGNALIKNVKTIIDGGFLRYYSNSLLVSIGSTVICVLFSSMAAYGLSVYRFPLRGKITTFIITSMMIPAQISLIGYSIEMRSLHLTNTLLPLILTWGASAYGVFFMIQYMSGSIPLELIESGRIDGCNELRIFFDISMPLIKPAIGTLAMLVYLWSWNNFLMPSIMLTDSRKFTVPLGIQTLATAYTQDWGARGAALTIAVIPILMIFAVGSKYFIKGLSAGAVKG